MSEVFVITAWNLVITALVATGGVVLWWALLRLLDRANGVDFFDVVHHFRYPEIYFGLRALAAALLIGWLVGGSII
jgi:hypothetical protein